METVFKDVPAEDSVFFILLRPVRVVGPIAYTTSTDEPVWVPAVVNEDNYKLSDDYKIELRSLVKGFSRETYYTSDFKSLLKEGRIMRYKLVAKMRNKLNANQIIQICNFM